VSLYPTLPTTVDPGFVALTSSYLCQKIEFPQLRAITLAQWALESGWGSSKLSKDYYNFGGMKWCPYMFGFATPAPYVANDGLDDYCAFPTLEKFIEGYWYRLDKSGAYGDWRKHVDTGDHFIAAIGPKWVGTNPLHQHQYVQQIMLIAQAHTSPIFGGKDA
jgi:N-acetylmuramoyl-L-alanine amidase